MLLHAVTIGCGDVVPTAVADARENRSAEVAEPTHELRIIVDENDAPVRIQVVRTSVGNRRLAPAAPARTERLVGQSARRQEILAQLPANRKGLEVVFYRGERSVKAVGSDADQALALDGLVMTANLEDPIYPEEWNDPLTPEQAAPLIDAEAARIEAAVNGYLDAVPEAQYEPWETPGALTRPDTCDAALSASSVLEMPEESPPPRCTGAKDGVNTARRLMVAAGVAALITLTAPFWGTAVPTMAAIYAAGAAAGVEVYAGGENLLLAGRQLADCLAGRT